MLFIFEIVRLVVLTFTTILLLVFIVAPVIFLLRSVRIESLISLSLLHELGAPLSFDDIELLVCIELRLNLLIVFGPTFLFLPM